MNITIIGAGKVGCALAIGLAQKGHKICLGVRNLQHFWNKTILGQKHITTQLVNSALENPEIIVLAIPPEAAPSLQPHLTSHKETIILDCTNSVFHHPEGFPTVFDWLVSGVKCTQVVKVFNTMGYENLYHPQGFDTYMAGDSAHAKEIAKQLAIDLGFDHCYDFGGNEKVALLEQLALCWINLALFQGLGTHFGINLVFPSIKP